jgi:hypothetical protein
MISATRVSITGAVALRATIPGTGRKGIFELLVISEPIRALISERAHCRVASESRGTRHGYPERMACGIFDGETTIEEVVKYRNQRSPYAGIQLCGHGFRGKAARWRSPTRTRRSPGEGNGAVSTEVVEADKTKEKRAKAKGGAKTGAKKGLASSDPVLAGRLSPSLTTFTRQLATLVDAGLPLLRVRVLEKQERNPTLKRALRHRHVNWEAARFPALAQHPKILSPFC